MDCRREMLCSSTFELLVNYVNFQTLLMSGGSGMSTGPPNAKKVNTTGSLESVALDIAAARNTLLENVAASKSETMELDNFAAAREAELLAEVELRRKIRMTPVSTDDQEVCLFKSYFTYAFSDFFQRKLLVETVYAV